MARSPSRPRWGRRRGSRSCSPWGGGRGPPAGAPRRGGGPGGGRGVPLGVLPTVGRVRLPRGVADVLAARQGEVAEIARHRFEGAAAGGGAEAATSLVAAGDAALGAFAYETAAANYWRAIEVDPP